MVRLVTPSSSAAARTPMKPSFARPGTAWMVPTSTSLRRRLPSEHGGEPPQHRSERRHGEDGHGCLPHTSGLGAVGFGELPRAPTQPRKRPNGPDPTIRSTSTKPMRVPCPHGCRCPVAVPPLVVAPLSLSSVLTTSSLLDDPGEDAPHPRSVAEVVDLVRSRDQDRAGTRPCRRLRGDCRPGSPERAAPEAGFAVTVAGAVAALIGKTIRG